MSSHPPQLNTGDPKWKYWAFISYSHKDARLAKWLHKRLETFKVPKKLIGRESRDGRIPSRMFPIFRDEDELPTSSDLGDAINEALALSRYLIVLCSPHAAKSKWVDKEVRRFKELERENRILSLILAGEPHASTKVEPEATEAVDGLDHSLKVASTQALECFPESLRFQVIDGQLTANTTEPLGADIRPGQDSRDTAILRIVAGLLGVDFDELRQRDRKRRRQNSIVFGIVVAATLLVFSGLSLQLSDSRRAARELEQQSFQNEQRAAAANKQADEEAKRANQLDVTKRLKSYVANLNLAWEHWTAGDTERVLALLKSVTPSAGEDDIRGFEWHYLWQRCHDEVGLFLDRDEASGKRYGVSGLAMTPDGTTLLSIDLEGWLRLWDLESGRLIDRIPIADVGISSISLSANGQLIAMSTVGGSTVDISTVTGKRVPTSRDLIGSNPLFLPDDRSIATNYGKEVKIYATDGTSYRSYWHEEDVVSVDCSQDGRLLAVAGGNVVRGWDTSTHRQLFSHREQRSRLRCVRVSPRGDFAAATGDDGRVTLWDVAAKRLVKSWRAHDGNVITASYSPDGECLATAADDGSICFWTSKGEFIERRIGNSKVVTCIAFSPTKKVVASGGDDGAIRLWNAPEIKTRIEFSDNEVKLLKPTIVAFSPDGTAMACGISRLVTVWKKPFLNSRSLVIKCTSSVDALRFSPDSRSLIIIDGDNVGVVSLEDGRRMQERKLEDLLLVDGSWQEAKFIHFGNEEQRHRLFATEKVLDGVPETGVPFGAYKVEIHRPTILDSQITEHDGAPYVKWALPIPGKKSEFVAVSRSGSKALVMSEKLTEEADNQNSSDFRMSVWDVANRRHLCDFQPPPQSWISYAAFLNEDTSVIAQEEDGTTYIWDASTGNRVALIGKFNGPIAVSPDSRTIALCDGADIQFWNLPAQELVGTLPATEANISSLTISPDGQVLVCGDERGNVRVHLASLTTRTHEQWKPIEKIAASNYVDPAPPPIVPATETLRTAFVDASKGVLGRATTDSELGRSHATEFVHICVSLMRVQRRLFQDPRISGGRAADEQARLIPEALRQFTLRSTARSKAGIVHGCEATISKLGETLALLESAEATMDVTVADGAWEEQSRLLAELSQTQQALLHTGESTLYPFDPRFVDDLRSSQMSSVTVSSGKLRSAVSARRAYLEIVAEHAKKLIELQRPRNAEPYLLLPQALVEISNADLAELDGDGESQNAALLRAEDVLRRACGATDGGDRDFTTNLTRAILLDVRTTLADKSGRHTALSEVANERISALRSACELDRERIQKDLDARPVEYMSIDHLEHVWKDTRELLGKLDAQNEETQRINDRLRQVENQYLQSVRDELIKYRDRNPEIREDQLFLCVSQWSHLIVCLRRSVDE